MWQHCFFYQAAFKCFPMAENTFCYKVYSNIDKWVSDLQDFRWVKWLNLYGFFPIEFQSSIHLFSACRHAALGRKFSPESSSNEVEGQTFQLWIDPIDNHRRPLKFDWNFEFSRERDRWLGNSQTAWILHYFYQSPKGRTLRASPHVPDLCRRIPTQDEFICVKKLHCTLASHTTGRRGYLGSIVLQRRSAGSACWKTAPWRWAKGLLQRWDNIFANQSSSRCYPVNNVDGDGPPNCTCRPNRLWCCEWLIEIALLKMLVFCGECRVHWCLCESEPGWIGKGTRLAVITIRCSLNRLWNCYPSVSAFI